jgi:hypothetical protein
MMSKMPKILLVTALVAAICLGQSQVATVSSASAFTLRGATVNPGQGVPSWPVLAGDTIKAGTSPVTLTFPDGSMITLDPGSEATVDLSGPTPVFRLRKGAAHYSLTTLTSVQIISGNQGVTVSNLIGTVVLEGAKRTGAIIAIAGAGAAAGLGVGVSQAVSGGSSVSPNH